MRRCVVLVVAAGVVAAVLVAPAGAQTPRGLSSEMNDGGSSVQCTATWPRTIIKSGQSCTIIQPAGGTAWCTERISTQGPIPIVQKCKIRQASTSRENVAYVVQVIQMKGGPSPQDATQIADVRQGNKFKNNRAYVTQVTKLALGGELDDDGEFWGQHTVLPGATQKQEVHESAIVCQGAAGTGPEDPANCRSGVGMLASNFSDIAQTQWESENAAASGAIVQEQNTEERLNSCTPTDAVDMSGVIDDDANICANVDQNTKLASPGAGKNESKLFQLYIQLQNADGAATADQCQGFPAAPCPFVSGPPSVGGLDHTINQTGRKLSSIRTDQHSFQVQRVDGVTVVVRKQDPKIAKGFGSSQGTHPDNVWKGRQTATQLQFEDGELGTSTQAALLEYFGETTGHISAMLFLNQNGDTQTDSCSGMSCSAFIASPPEDT